MYIEKTPNLCINNRRLGIRGVRHRVVHESSGDNDEEDLCCGTRNFTGETSQLLLNQQCNCVFKWCCTVTCNACNRTATVNYCNG